MCSNPRPPKQKRGENNVSQAWATLLFWHFYSFYAVLLIFCEGSDFDGFFGFCWKRDSFEEIVIFLLLDYHHSGFYTWEVKTYFPPYETYIFFLDRHADAEPLLFAPRYLVPAPFCYKILASWWQKFWQDRIPGRRDFTVTQSGLWFLPC